MLMNAKRQKKGDDVCEYDGYTIYHDNNNPEECQRIREEAKAELIRFQKQMEKKYGISPHRSRKPDKV